MPSMTDYRSGRRRRTPSEPKRPTPLTTPSMTVRSNQAAARESHSEKRTNDDVVELVEVELAAHGVVQAAQAHLAHASLDRVELVIRLPAFAGPAVDSASQRRGRPVRRRWRTAPESGLKGIVSASISSVLAKFADEMMEGIAAKSGPMTGKSSCTPTKPSRMAKTARISSGTTMVLLLSEALLGRIRCAACPGRSC